jgi:uncharacterized protein (UPF0332 family)
MKRLSFLARLGKQGKLELVEPSNEICSAYLDKAENSLKSARILFENKLYENSVSMSYYTMYNSLTALFFKVGIKCENHAGSLIVFKKLFRRDDLLETICFAKNERIDKQYYVDSTLTKESAMELVKKAETFLVEMKLLIAGIKTGEINEIRDRLKMMLAI